MAKDNKLVIVGVIIAIFLLSQCDSFSSVGSSLGGSCPVCECDDPRESDCDRVERITRGDCEDRGRYSSTETYTWRDDDRYSNDGYCCVTYDSR